MNIKITDSHLFFTYDDEKQRKLFNKFFTFEDKTSVFAGGKYDVNKIRRINFIKSKNTLNWLRSGFLQEFLIFCKRNNIEVKIDDDRTKLSHQKRNPSKKDLEKYFPFEYNEHQIEALQRLLKVRRGIIKSVTGTGKCFGKDTEIIMGDGRIERVQNIKDGDFVLGVNSEPKKVFGVMSGFGKLYKIKSKYDEYIVNEEHILSLKITNIGSKIVNAPDGKKYRTGEIANISIKDYFKGSSYFKHVAKLWKKDVDFPEKDVLIEPYFLGLWLGDGNSSGPAITTMDYEIKDYIYEISDKNNLKVKIEEQKDNKADTYHITSGTYSGSQKRNIIRESLKHYNLIKNKHIPFDYKINSREKRLELLAGLIDTDGYVDSKSSTFDIVQRNKVLIEDIKFLCDSLGFYSKITEKRIKGYDYPFYRMGIYGEGIEEIPTKIKRKRILKRTQIKNPLVCGFEIESVGEGEYFGFQIEGEDKLFFLKDFQVVHNTEILFAFLLETQEPALIVVDRVLLAEQLTQRAKNAGLKNVGILTGKMNDTENKKIVFATIGSIKKLPAINSFRILVTDECHHASSKRFQDFLELASFPVQIGFSATPDKEDKYIFALIRQYFGGIVFETDAENMMDNNVIAKPKIFFIENEVNPMIDWPSTYRECIIQNKERNSLITDIVEKHSEKVLILIKDVKNKQGEILKQYMLENTSKNVEFIQGSTKNRQEVLDWFENGDLDVLIATNILNEGVSLKQVRILVNASGGKSKVENLQKLGRGTRIMSDKKEVIIYDFADMGNKFTQSHSKQRKKLYEKEGFKNIEFISQV